jgi:hypothetical protein
MIMSETKDFYPLYLHDLTKIEKDLMVDILQEAKDHQLIRQSSLEEMIQKRGITRSSLRYFFTPRERAKASLEPSSDVVYEKWCVLYNYIMTTFRQLCLAVDNTSLLTKIDALHKLGRDSGRYRTDMHIFNNEVMFFDTYTRIINQLYKGLYIGFRYDSGAQKILVFGFEFHSRENRDIFTAYVLNEGFRRDTGGIVYETSNHVYCTGFMNEVQGFETYALRTDDQNCDVLFGLMNTVSRHGVIHAKHCCMIRAEMVTGVETARRIGDIRDLRGKEEMFFSAPFLVRRSNSRPFNIRRFISKEIFYARSENEEEAIGGIGEGGVAVPVELRV